MSTPTEATTPEPLTTLSVSGYLDCGLGASGATYCWGLDVPGYLPTSVVVPGTFTRALPAFALRQIEAGSYHVCGIAPDGVAWCWGGPSPVAWGSGNVRSTPDGTPQPARVAGQ